MKKANKLRKAVSDSDDDFPVDSTNDDIKELVDRLDFTTESVSEAAVEQAVLFHKACEHRVAIYRRRASAEAALEEVKSRRYLALREESREGGEKITEKNLEALLVIDPPVLKAQAAVYRAEADEEAARLLLEAWRMRRDCLRVVSELNRDERALKIHAQIGSSALEETRKKLSEKYSGE